MKFRSPLPYDTPFLIQLVSTMHSFQITNRIMRRCSMFLDLKMETIHNIGSPHMRGGTRGGDGVHGM